MYVLSAKKGKVDSGKYRQKLRGGPDTLVKFIKKCDGSNYKVRQLFLLQSVTACYYKVRQLFCYIV